MSAGAISGLLPDEVLLTVIGVTLLYFGADLLREKNLSPPAVAHGLDIRAAVIWGAVIGLLGGIVGLILGALRMPALLRYVGETPARAVGTNMAVGVCVGVAGLAGHLASGVDWSVFWLGSVASIPGAFLGARLTGLLEPRQLLKAIAFMLLAAGAAMIVQAFA